MMGVEEKGAGVAIDQDIFFFAPLERIKPVDVTKDDVQDFEYILHSIADGRAEMTVRLVKQVKVVVEKPIYIDRLYIIMIAILTFIYQNMCAIALILVLLALIILCILVSRRAEQEEKKNK
jgi:hypothetical protein